MKKLLFAVLGASVALNIYLVNVEVVVKDELDQEAPQESIGRGEDTISIAQAAVKKPAASHLAQKQDCEEKIVEKIVYRDRDVSNVQAEELDFPQEEYEERFKELSQRYEKEWSRKSREFFEYRLGLSFSQQEDFQRLKSERESALGDLFKSSSSDSGEGANEKRILSPEEIVQLGKVNERFTRRLKDLFGERAYREYIGFRDSYNEKLMNETSDGAPFTVQF